MTFAEDDLGMLHITCTKLPLAVSPKDKSKEEGSELLIDCKANGHAII